MIVQGIADNLFPLDEAVRNHAAVAANGVPTRMLWFCGGHGTCVTDPGDVQRIERETIAWLRRYVMRDRSVDTGAPFTWVDQEGRWHESGAYPLRAGAPLAGEGSGTLPLTPTGGSGGVVPRDGDPIGGLGAPFAASRAANAVNVAIPGPDRQRHVVGAPRLELTYSGLSSQPDARIFAQVVDDATGHVLGNQIVPIPLTLDGQRRTVVRDLEIVAALAQPGSGYTLQLTPASTLYNVAQRAGGAVQVESAKVTLPTGDPVAVPTGAGGAANRPGARRCTSRRSVVVHVKRRYRKRLRSVRVLVGKRVVARSRRASRGLRVRLAGRPRGTVRVRLVMRLRGGRTVTDVRTFRLCARKNAR
jgi:ABC-2 type transport system ATP-binding protein